jgi:3-phosphoglycerate kinase
LYELTLKRRVVMKKSMIFAAVLAGSLMAGSAQALDAGQMLNDAIAIGGQGAKIVITAKTARAQMNLGKQGAIDLLKTLPPECQETVGMALDSLTDGVNAALAPIEALVALMEAINDKIIKQASASSAAKLTSGLAPIKAQLVLIEGIVPGIKSGMTETAAEIKAAQAALDQEALEATKKSAADLVANPPAKASKK